MRLILMLIGFTFGLTSIFAQKNPQQKLAKPHKDDYLWFFQDQTLGGLQVRDSLFGSSNRVNYQIRVGYIPDAKEWGLDVRLEGAERSVFRFTEDQADSLVMVSSTKFTWEMTAFILRYLKGSENYVVYLIDADKGLFSRSPRIPASWRFEPEFFDHRAFSLKLPDGEVPLVLDK
jgi:hypothetical protein